MLEFRDELQTDVSHCAKAYRKAAKAKATSIDTVRTLAQAWQRATDLYDRINEPLPDRYRKRLEDRFWPGVSDQACNDDGNKGK